MAIEKITEFAKSGNKNTDDLDLETGFIPSRKPARQWFNWLFNTLTLKINEVIDADFVPKTDIVDNLTTSDTAKPLSAAMGKKLQDDKLDKSDLNNTLTSTSTTQALTAAQGKVLNDKSFGINQDYADKKSTRVLNTTYYNTTDKTIFVSVGIALSDNQVGTATAYVDNRAVATNTLSAPVATYTVGVIFPVAPGKPYLVKSINGLGLLDFWMEFTV